jgi:hypothetical protein
MSRGYTVVTTQEPDPAAMAWAIADIDPEFLVMVDPENEVWRVMAEDGETELMIVETPSHVRVKGEMLRLFGTSAGLDIEAIDPRGWSWWQDVHAVGADPRSDAVTARFCQSMAHLGLGTCIELGPRFKHLGQTGEDLKEEWK